jgi:tryptophan synthase beta chain
VGPEHSHWKEQGRAQYLSRTDDQALAAIELLARTEGILCALETAHAIAALPEVAAAVRQGERRGRVIVNLSGRGDKDMVTIARRRAEARQGEAELTTAPATDERSRS